MTLTGHWARNDLAATLSHVETRQVTNDYTARYQGKLYQIDRQDTLVDCEALVSRYSNGWMDPSQFASRIATCACIAAQRRRPWWRLQTANP